MWGSELLKSYSDVVEFVGLCDINPKRVKVASEIMGTRCPTFTNFDEMCDKAKPDLLMITTVDATHAEYIAKGLDRGIDVMTEKLMVTDENQCQAVLDAEKRNNRKIVVTFNYRYARKHRKIKEILLSGEIGPITSIDFSWYLDVSHGASYFRRWHRLKSKGGSLWVHKASHHFEEETEIYLTKSFGKREKIPIQKSEGGHGGGDTRLTDLIFRKVKVPDYMRLPDSCWGDVVPHRDCGT